MSIVIWIIAVMCGGSLLWAGSAIFLGYTDVKSRPREEMMWCAKGHGHFRKGYCLPMAGTLVCPQCYLDSIKDAGETKLWKK